MIIVIDTNVMISGVFFGGAPRKVLEAVIDRQVKACASTEIIEEYEEIVQEMIDRKQGKIKKDQERYTLASDCDIRYYQSCFKGENFP